MPERVKVEGDYFHGVIPAGSIYIGRPAPGFSRSRWANPFAVGSLVEDPDRGDLPPQPHKYRCAEGAALGYAGGERYFYVVRKVRDAADAVALFIRWAQCQRDDETGLTYAESARKELAGKTVACWCPEPGAGEPDLCHGVPLMAMAAGRRMSTPDVTDGNGRTVVKVKRCCNGCGEQIGDVTYDEIRAAMDGQPQSDVRSECPRCTPEIGEGNG